MRKKTHREVFMWKQKISISIYNNNYYKRPVEEIVSLIKSVGFDGISPEWAKDVCLDSLIAKAREEGLALVSFHAPYNGAADIWSEDEAVGNAALADILSALYDAHRYEIPVLVCHVWIGFGEEPMPTEAGLSRLEALVKKAKEYGITVAFENTEGDEHLAAVMDHFKDEPSVGYCWDSGHEMCYNHSRDLLALYGDRLAVTHLNDNLGISRFNGDTFWTDDLHLLPYDGIADWEDNIARLKKSRPLTYLNFELNRHSKPNRFDNERYANMTCEDYFSRAYAVACRIAYRYAK